MRITILFFLAHFEFFRFSSYNLSLTNNVLLLYLLYRYQDSINYLPSKNITNETNINKNKCNNCENCISCNINLKCLNQQMPWKGLFIPKQIDSSINKVKYILF